MILNIVYSGNEAVTTQLLLVIKTEVQNKIQLYESAKDLFDKIDPIQICSSAARIFDPFINHQAKKTQEHWTEVRNLNNSLDSIGYREHAQWEEDKLSKQLEIAQKYYDIEKNKLNQLYDKQCKFNNEAGKYLYNLFNDIYSLSLAFLKIVNLYITHKISTTEERIKKIDKKIAPIPAPSIEPDMVFKTKTFDKLLILERKLISDKYLSNDLHWVARHKNGKINIKKLATFLTALIDNDYFLPNHTPEIRTFFESRYHISIGQSFEEARRKPLIAEYSVVFCGYPFKIV